MRHKVVTITPLISTPAKIDKKPCLNFIPSIDATIAPVQAPVQGSGMPTNTIKPILSYLSIDGVWR